MRKLHHLHIALLSVVAAVVLTAAMGCSTQKNTAKTRWWHSFNARYNTYYNGTLAYIDGSLEKENGNKDNFTELIPLYTVSNKGTRETGKANFDRAIEKCQKAIKLHSIKRRPEWTKKRKKTERDLEWLQRKEYNPFLWKAWMLMGRSQFHKGAFDEAASTFSYMSRLYHTQPAIYGRARAWLAKCYIEEGWLYDAEDVIRNMKRDSIHWRAQKEWDYTYADYYIHTADYAKAIPYLRRVIKHEMRRKQKAREWYLLGQLEAALGNKQNASKAFKHVIRLSPPYEVEFNARIALTEVLSTGGQAKKMVSRLKRMAASDKNKEYLDQVYYAIGNIYLAQRDTAKAIDAYEKGNSKATRAGIEKGVLLLKLGDIYWAKEKYSDAQRCYGEAIGLLDKERPDYEQLSQRSKVLDELVPYTDAVHLQDSLQWLAKADEKTRNEAIDRVIEALKKKEKEEQRKQAEKNAEETIAQNGGTGNNNAHRKNNTQQNNASQQGKGLWYFYNQMTVNQGKQDFQKRWGKRENVDNWQRINKTVVAIGSPDTQPQLTEQQADSIARAEALADSLEQVKDSAQNDPHKREYYLAQIPFTEEQIEASNQTIMDGLFNAGVIFKDKLDNLPLSEKALRRLETQYPDYNNMADAFYHLFLLYSRKGDTATAQQYVNMLKDKYPDNEWTTLVTDPFFKENAALGVHLEDSLYATTYDAFKAAKYDVVSTNAKMSAQRFPLGANRDKFMFIGALTKLNEGRADSCVADLKKMLEKYPQSGLAEMAGMIVRGVGEGRQLHGGQFDIGNVWERRTMTLNDNDTTATRQLSAERNTNFVFMIAFQPDSLDANRLLFEMARYNFTSYLVRNFDISTEGDGALQRMTVSGFRNYDEALQYARNLYAQKAVMQQARKGRCIIVSEENLPLLGRQFSFDDYDRFYDKHFAPLKTAATPLFEDVEILNPDDVPSKAPSNDEEQPIDNNGSTIIPFDEPTNAAPVENGATVIPMEEPKKEEPVENGATVIPMEEPKKEEPVENGATVIPMEEPKKEEPVENGATVIPMEEPKKEEPVENRGETIVTLEEPKAQELPKVQERPKAEEKTKSQQHAKPQQQPQQQVQQLPQQSKPVETKPREDDIYFDDTPTSNKQDKNKENKIDLEDEYYDLDGF